MAEEMLAVARVPAARVLLQIVEDYLADPCETCGRPQGDPTPVIRAATAVLDRTGFHPTLTLEVERQGPLPYAKWISNDELKLIGQILATAEARMRAGEPTRDRDDVVEVVVADVAEVTSTKNESIPQADAIPNAVDALTDDAKALDTQGLDDDTR